jgi:hypothetical protein
MVMWQEVTQEFLDSCPDLFGKFFWVRCGKEVYLGKYQWAQGRRPDRFICWFENGFDDIDAIGCFIKEVEVPT